MSISVALRIEKGGRQFHLAVGTIFAFSWYKFARDKATHGAQGEWKIKRISRWFGRGNGPEQAKEPIIDASKEAGHFVGVVGRWCCGEVIVEVCSANWLEELSR